MGCSSNICSVFHDFRSVPGCIIRWQSKTWAMILFVFQFSKTIVCYLGSVYSCESQEWAQKFINNFMRLLPLALPSLWYFPVSKGSTFWSSGQRSGALLSLLFYALSLTVSASRDKWWEDKEKEALGVYSPSSWGHNSSDQREDLPPSVLGFWGLSCSWVHRIA